MGRPASTSSMKLATPSHEGVPIVPHAQVRTVVAMQGTAVGHKVGLLRHLIGVHGIVLSTDHQRGHGDLSEAIGDVPLNQTAAHAEFTGSLHEVVQLVVQALKRTRDGFGPLFQSAEVLGVKMLVDQLEERLVLNVARGPQRLQGCREWPDPFEGARPLRCTPHTRECL